MAHATASRNAELFDVMFSYPYILVADCRSGGTAIEFGYGDPRDDAAVTRALAAEGFAPLFAVDGRVRARRIGGAA